MSATVLHILQCHSTQYILYVQYEIYETRTRYYIIYEPRKTKSPVFSPDCSKGFFMGIGTLNHSI